MPDAFLSDEDLDLQNLSFAELVEVWNRWLAQAQATNQEDQYLYSHGVFLVDPCDPDYERTIQRIDRF